MSSFSLAACDRGDTLTTLANDRNAVTGGPPLVAQNHLDRPRGPTLIVVAIITAEYRFLAAGLVSNQEKNTASDWDTSQSTRTTLLDRLSRTVLCRTLIMRAYEQHRTVVYLPQRPLDLMQLVSRTSVQFTGPGRASTTIINGLGFQINPRHTALIQFTSGKILTQTFPANLWTTAVDYNSPRPVHQSIQPTNVGACSPTISLCRRRPVQRRPCCCLHIRQDIDTLLPYD